MRRTVALLTLTMVLAAVTNACSEEATAPRSDAEASTGSFSGGSSSSARSTATAFLCANPSGSVFVRDHCKQNEDQLDLVALGLVGPPGPPGSPGVSGYQIVQNRDTLAAGVTAQVNVECPTGKKVLGGGFSTETPIDVRLFSSSPSDGSGNISDHAWNVFVQNSSTVVRQTTAIAICANVQ